MSQSRIFLAGVAALLAGTSLAVAQEWTTVRIGTEGAYAPFNYIDSNNELQGFDIDIAKALCAEMKVECTFVVQEWDGMIPALTSNKFDAIIASMSITEERKQHVDFSEKYYNTPPALVVPKDSALADVTPEALSGATIGAQSASTHANFVEQKLPDVDLRLYPTADENLLDLSNGRLDGSVDDVVVLDNWAKSEAGACCKILGTFTPDPEINGLGAGVAVRKEDTALRDMFSNAIAAIRANGVYKQINDKYFTFDVYGD